MSKLKRRSTSIAVLASLAVLALYARWPAGTPPERTANKVVVFKDRRRMDLLRDDRLLKSYRVALGRSPVGPKLRAGDHRTPEGLYYLDWRNPRSKFHLSLHISYPNQADAARAHQNGEPAGGDIMIHGLQNGLGWLGRLHRFMDWTDGCIAVTNAEMDEIWKAVPDGTPIEIGP
jgi:murein L,D-transpeptidase YafK